MNTVDVPHLLPAEWDGALGPLDFHLSREWLAFTRDSSERYGTILTVNGANGAWRGGMAVHELDHSAGLHIRIDHALDRTHEARLADRDPDLTRTFPQRVLPTLTCGGRSLGRSRLVGTNDGLTHDEARTLIGAAEDLARKRQLASISMLFVDSRDTTLLEVLDGAGFVVVGTRSLVNMHCPWSSFEGYLSELPSKRRRSVRRERRQMDRAGWRIEHHPLDDESARIMARLTCVNERKYGNPVTEEAQLAYYEKLLRWLPGRVQVLLARSPEGEIGAGATWLQWRQGLYPREIGIDRSVAANAPLYFELGFYVPVEIAASAGATHIDYAVGLEDVKRSRGCDAVPSLSLVKCLDPATQGQLKRALLSS